MDATDLTLVHTAVSDPRFMHCLMLTLMLVSRSIRGGRPSFGLPAPAHSLLSATVPIFETPLGHSSRRFH
jgi:hypothetical protein